MSGQEPRLELIPRRSAVAVDGSVTLDVLVRITPPPPPSEASAARPPINLGLVLDRSGSMTGRNKMSFAIDAACFAVEQLLPTDRVSVTIFDEAVDVVVPSTLATDKASVLRAIRSVSPRGSTDLHGGWAAAAGQVAEHRLQGGLNRVVLLSDGLANQGVTDPNAIAAAVKARAGQGVSTTTIGLGEDYNEDLMEAMSEAGDGNYYFIESPVMLPDLFASELRGLMATHGQRVSLGLECGEGVAVADVLNDFDRLPTGRLKLANLVAAMPQNAVVRLNVAPRPNGAPGLVLSTRLAWDPPRGAARRSVHTRLDLPAVPLASWALLPEHPDVLEHEALLMAARAQKEAALAMQRGDEAATRAAFSAAGACYLAVPPSPAVAADLATLREMEADYELGNIAGSAKIGKFASWRRRKSQGDA